MSLKVGLVTRVPDRRLAMARALDHAPKDWVVTLDAGLQGDVDVLVADDTVDLPGAIYFDPASCTDLIQRIAARARTAGGLVVVTSPSGGTGVTSVALHLAVAFAARHETGVVDLTPERGIRQRLGLIPVDDDADERVLPIAGGFRLFEGGRALERAEEKCERVVIDASPGAFPDVRIDAQVVLIVSPSPQGARRARSLAERWPDQRWHPIVNRLGRGGETTVNQLSEMIGMPIYSELPCCPALRDAEDDHRLLINAWNRWSRGVARLAAHLER
jgi:hypothetical protein